MKKIVKLCTLALAISAAITFTACVAIGGMVAANNPAKYTMRSIMLRNDAAYRAVFKDTAPGANEIKVYLCTKPELDAYFELVKAQTSSATEEIPKRGLSLSDIGNKLQPKVDGGYLSVTKKNEILNALDYGNCAIYTTTITFQGLPTFEIDGFYKE